MKAASCFSGIGAPEMGGPEYQWLWHAEIEKFPAAVMAVRFPDSINLGDVTADDFMQRASSFGQLDLLVGGPPCQAFSIAGLRQSLSDDRGNLSLRFLEIARAIRPRNLLVENVPGWLNTPDNAFGCFLGGLVGADDVLHPPAGGGWPSAGMVAGPWARCAWRVFDAQYFGVAQRRRRVFLVADFGNGADPAAVLFERKGSGRHSPPSREAGKGFAADVAPSLVSSGRGVERCGETRGQDPVVAVTTLDRQSSGEYGTAPVASTVSARDYKGASDLIAHTLRGEGFDASEDGTGRGVPLVPVSYRTSGNSGAYATGDTTDALTTSTDPNSHVVAFSCKDYGNDATANLSPTLRSMNHNGSHANGGGSSRDYVAFCETPWDNQEKRIHDVRRGLSPTLPARCNGGGTVDGWFIEPPAMAVRRLTPTECARLQGFPDNHTAIHYRGKLAADGPQYKAYGNSWAVPCGRWIIKRLAELQAAQTNRQDAA